MICVNNESHDDFFGENFVFGLGFFFGVPVWGRRPADLFG
jgi:hypothetical protein